MHVVIPRTVGCLSCQDNISTYWSESLIFLTSFWYPCRREQNLLYSGSGGVAIDDVDSVGGIFRKRALSVGG